MNVLDRLGIHYLTIAADDGETVYYVTQDTGECVGAAFAYAADDVDNALRACESYEEFCRRFDALDTNDADYEEVAVQCAMRGVRLLRPGTCVPILGASMFDAIQRAARAKQK